MFTKMVQRLCSVSIIARVPRINNRFDASAFLLTPYAGSNNNPLFHKNQWSVRSPENAHFFQSTPFSKVLNMLFIQRALFKEPKRSFNSFKNTIDEYDGIYWKDLFNFSSLTKCRILLLVFWFAIMYCFNHLCINQYLMVRLCSKRRWIYASTLDSTSVNERGSSSMSFWVGIYLNRIFHLTVGVYPR